MATAYNSPALHISNIVYGRTKQGNRVTYLIDQECGCEQYAVSETLVLKRWRKRTHASLIFQGCRLSPNVWRAVGLALGMNAEGLFAMSDAALSERIQARVAELKKHHYVLPAVPVLKALFAVCGPERLQAILDRHHSSGHRGKSGVPDLFLYALKAQHAKPSYARFVEVKRPDERISEVQCEEIEFLRSIGLQARVLRLIERVR